MFFSENIYFLILFTLPAALNIIYNAHIRHVPVTKTDKSVELAECVIYCLAVFLGNIVVMHKEMALFVQYALLQQEEMVRFCNDTGFSYINFMVKYFLVNIAMSVVVLFGWYTLGQWLIRKIENAVNKYKDRPEELKFSDVWSNVFETEEYINPNDFVVSIEKNGSVITAGVVMIYSSPSQEKKEFLLTDTDLIRQIFEDDKNISLEYRVFPQALYEYYDIERDILIKLYDTEKYNKIYR